ncbi:MAG: hypothetical protein ACHQ1D_00565 [Nitrososphaerales archaeon]
MAKFKLGPNQKKWIKALRSGKYAQGNGCLYDAELNEYCCLGVACEIAGMKKVEKFVDAMGSMTHYGKEYSIAPKKVVKLLKLRYQDGAPKDSSNFDLLIDLNDDGSSFEDIACTIEQNPEQYFTGPV